MQILVCTMSYEHRTSTVQGEQRRRAGARRGGETRGRRASIRTDWPRSPGMNRVVRHIGHLTPRAPCTSSYAYGVTCRVGSARRERKPKLPACSRDGLEALPRLPDPRTTGCGRSSPCRAQRSKAHGGQVDKKPDPQTCSGRRCSTAETNTTVTRLCQTQPRDGRRGTMPPPASRYARPGSD